MNRLMLHILVIATLNDFSLYFMRPFLPYYIQQIGGPDWLVVVFPSVVALTMAISTPIFGRLSDRFGGRTILAIGSFGAAAAFLAMAQAASVFLLLFYRAIAGAMAGTAVVTQASIGRTVDPGLQSLAMGYLGAASNLAIVLAPVASAAFLYVIDAGNTTRWVFVVSAMVSVVAGAWSLAWFKVPPPEQLPQRNQNSLKSLLGRMNVATRRKSITVAMIGGGIAFTNFVLLAVLPLSIQRRFGWGGRELALLLFFSAGAAVLSQTFLMKRAIIFIREEALLSLALCMLCVGTFGFGFVQSGLVASSCYVAFLATYAIANGVLGGILSGCAEPSGRASLFGYYIGFRNLAQIAGPLLAAVAFERWGIEYAIIVATLIAVMTFGASLSLTLKSRLTDAHGAL